MTSKKGDSSGNSSGKGSGSGKVKGNGNRRSFDYVTREMRELLRSG
jgi:hypothetical protein